MSKYCFLCLIAAEFLFKVPQVNAQGIISQEVFAEQSLTQLGVSENLSTKNNLLISEIPLDTVPSGAGETISQIQVRFVDRQGNSIAGKTQPDIITREFDLQPGDIYSADSVLLGLSRVNKLVIVEQATVTLEPTTNEQVVMVVKVLESSRFFFSLASTLTPPTALQGLTRPVTVVPMSNKAGGLSKGVRLGINNLGGNNQSVTLGIEGGKEIVGLDLDYRKFIKQDTGYAVNFFTRKSVESEFDGGDRDVNLANGDDPWVDRIGGGVEFFHPLVGDF